MKQYLNVKSQSVDTSGITKDYKIALCEYIWNGFEANANTVELTFEGNSLGGIDSITISDNGDGICFETLLDTFGGFLTSMKNSLSTQIKSKSNKGKGRFSFNAFATSATWTTVYKKDDDLYEYRVTVDSIEKNAYDPTPPVKSEKSHTGSSVTFTNTHKLLLEALDFSELEKPFLTEFSWYLYLNRNNGVTLKLNGLTIDYKRFIDDGLSERMEHTIDEDVFSIDIIIWKEKIKEKFCVYYIDEGNELKDRTTTTFNRNTVDFNHSAFVKSTFFDNYIPTAPPLENQVGLEGYKKNDKTIKILNAYLQKVIEDKLHTYLLHSSEAEVEKMRERGSFPRFSSDSYGQLRERDFVNVTKELYCLESKIFYNLKPVQEKSLLGFLNLLLGSEERQNILTIIDGIVRLTPEQRADFANILSRTKLENVVESIKFIENRYIVIEGLKLIVNELKNYANEREHIQKIVERNYWLFGEQYNIVSADERMQKALENYTYHLYGANKLNAVLHPDEEENRRMDIFLCRKRKVEDSNETELEENIVVELKAPNVKLNKKVYRQIEDYMSFVTKQDGFKSQLQRWKFIAVCREVDDEIKSKYTAFKDKGKRFLVYQVEQYEIYAMTWDDVFKSFELRHGFVLDKLKYDCEAIANELIGNGAVLSKDLVNEITNTIKIPV